MSDYTPLPSKRIKDLRDQRFGRLTVIEFSHFSNTSYWLCRCDCSKEITTRGSSLRNGHTKSCGCLQLDYAKSKRPESPHHTSKSEYRIWSKMKARCHNPNDKAYPRYGGRGIAVCDSWLSHFSDFLNDMGPRPSPKHTLDRIDNDGPYSPDNCRWATYLEQANNTRITRKITWNNETHTVTEWSTITGLSRDTIVGRILLGWTAADTLSTPLKVNGERHYLAKLTEDNVRQIRSLYQTGNYSMRKLGEQFDVSYSTIQLIIKRKNWAHLP